MFPALSRHASRLPFFYLAKLGKVRPLAGVGICASCAVKPTPRERGRASASTLKFFELTADPSRAWA